MMLDWVVYLDEQWRMVASTSGSWWLAVLHIIYPRAFLAGSWKTR